MRYFKYYSFLLFSIACHISGFCEQQYPNDESIQLLDSSVYNGTDSAENPTESVGSLEEMARGPLEIANDPIESADGSVESIRAPTKRRELPAIIFSQMKKIWPQLSVVIVVIQFFLLVWLLYKLKKSIASVEELKKPGKKLKYLQSVTLPSVKKVFPRGEDQSITGDPQVIKDMEALLGKHVIPNNAGLTVDLGSATPICPLDKETLDSFSNLILVGEVQEGTESTVYQVRSPSDDRLYVIKILKGIHHQDIGINNEIEFVRSIFADDDKDHPSDPFKKSSEMGQSLLLATYKGPIVPLRLEDPVTVLIYEAKRTDLDMLLKQQAQPKRRQLSKHTKVHWARQILLAGLHLAKTGYVHNDIKPSNVLIDANGDIQLCDYGGVQLGGEKVHRILYSPHYVEPERNVVEAWNFSPFTLTDARSDLYSLGVTLFVLFTSKVPLETLFTRLDKNLEVYNTDLLLMNPDMGKLDYPLILGGTPDDWIDCIKDLLHSRRFTRLTPDEVYQKYAKRLGLE